MRKTLLNYLLEGGVLGRVFVHDTGYPTERGKDETFKVIYRVLGFHVSERNSGGGIDEASRPLAYNPRTISKELSLNTEYLRPERCWPFFDSNVSNLLHDVEATDEQFAEFVANTSKKK